MTKNLEEPFELPIPLTQKETEEEEKRCFWDINTGKKLPLLLPCYFDNNGKDI